MRSLVNVMLQYGLVTVPVGVATTAKRNDPSFRQLHEKCMAPLKQHYACSKCGEIVEKFEIVRGFEFVKNQFLAIENDDLEKLAVERSKVVTISKIVPWDSVDEASIESNYYLVPNQDVAALVKPYLLLSQALYASQSAAVATASLWGKEYPAMVWPREGGALLISMLYCHDEVVADTEIRSLLAQEGAQPSPQEEELAKEFVAMHMGQLVPEEDLRSKSRERVQEFLAARTQGIDFEFAPVAEAPEVTFDLLDRLRASVEGGERKKVTA